MASSSPVWIVYTIRPALVSINAEGEIDLDPPIDNIRKQRTTMAGNVHSGDSEIGRLDNLLCQCFVV